MSDLNSPIGPWQATLAGVEDLLPNVTFVETLDPGKRGVTLDDVTRYVTDVSGRVSARLMGWERLTAVQHQELVIDGARDLVHTGAASYAQAARYPEQSSRNSDGYAQVLWERFESGLDDLATELAGWLGDADVAAPQANSRPGCSFPPPRFRDGFQF